MERGIWSVTALVVLTPQFPLNSGSPVDFADLAVDKPVSMRFGASIGLRGSHGGVSEALRDLVATPHASRHGTQAHSSQPPCPLPGLRCGSVSAASAAAPPARFDAPRPQRPPHAVVALPEQQLPDPSALLQPPHATREVPDQRPPPVLSRLLRQHLVLQQLRDLPAPVKRLVRRVRRLQQLLLPVPVPRDRWPRAASKDSRHWPRCGLRWRVTASSGRCQARAPNDRSGAPASSPYSVPRAAFRG